MIFLHPKITRYTVTVYSILYIIYMDFVYTRNKGIITNKGYIVYQTQLCCLLVLHDTFVAVIAHKNITIFVITNSNDIIIVPYSMDLLVLGENNQLTTRVVMFTDKCKTFIVNSDPCWIFDNPTAILGNKIAFWSEHFD